MHLNPASPRFHACRRAQRLLPALCAWLLLSLQVPWHIGMSGGMALTASPGDSADYTALARTLGINCGPTPDAQTLQALVDGGLLDAASLPQPGSHADDLSLCDLFTGLAAPLAFAQPFAVDVFASAAANDFNAFVAPASPRFRLPPARAPPAPLV